MCSQSPSERGTNRIRNAKMLPARILSALEIPIRFWRRQYDPGVSEEVLGGVEEKRETFDEKSRCLIVGLGNPGAKHKNHRHNVGFMAVESVANRHQIAMDRSQKKAIIGQGLIGGRPVILAKPMTYMNLSGESIGPLVRYYKIALEDILVIYDELDLPLGTIRIRETGGAGGHNGMKSLIGQLGPGFPRLRIGIGRPPGKMSPAAFVLQGFSAEEIPIVSEAISEVERAVETFLQFGVELTMSRHNGPVENPA